MSNTQNVETVEAPESAEASKSTKSLTVHIDRDVWKAFQVKRLDEDLKANELAEQAFRAYLGM